MERQRQGETTPHHPSLIRLAGAWVGNAEEAQAIADATWVAFLGHLDEMYELDELDERCSGGALHRVLMAMLVAHARDHARRAGTPDPMSSLGLEVALPVVDRGRFAWSGVPWIGHWSTPPTEFPVSLVEPPEASEWADFFEVCVVRLPAAERPVVILCDVEGLAVNEVCSILGIGETYVMRFLHRARSGLWAMLEQSLEGRIS